MIYHRLKADLEEAVKNLGFSNFRVELMIPQSELFGDYTTNVALQLAKLSDNQSYHSPEDIANKLLSFFQNKDYIEHVEIKGVGFINFYLKPQILLKKLELEIPGNIAKNKKYLVEYAQPNTHKPFHIGHLRNIAIGESISRLLEDQGAEVFRATYDGDIGPHVAKALWGLLKHYDEYLQVKEKNLEQKVDFLGKVYAQGATAYEEDEEARKEIQLINNKLYARDKSITSIWEETRRWSLDYFETIYQTLGTKFDRVYLESEVESLGKKIVLEHLDNVFIYDQEAVIFPGEKYGLHNRVFITQAGYPTYEGKEIGLTFLEKQDFNFDVALHIVAKEQTDYFKVVIKAIEMIAPELRGKKKHLPYGLVNLKTGKMSSRTGEVVTAKELLETLKEKLLTKFGESQLQLSQKILEQVAVGAAKFSMLKFALSTDITFDIDTSISLQGDSGPYLQYTYARINSVLAQVKDPQELHGSFEINAEERQLLRWLEYFEMIREKATQEYKPNLLAEYLLGLAKTFNLFYQHNPILTSDKRGLRLALSSSTAKTLQRGLYLLGIEAPEKM